MPYEPNKTEAVKNLQRYLRRLSYENPLILPVPIDGIFDSRTAEALSEFQRSRSLPVTGRADRVTWELLYAEYLRLSTQEDRLVEPSLFPRAPADYETQRGEEHAFILLAQWILGELTLIYDDLGPVEPNGRLDEATERAIGRFQELNALPVTGQINRSTWNRLSEEFNNLRP